MVLNPSEYDASYFDGALQTLKHNAGYSYYKRWKRYKGENSLGEYWKDKAKKLFDKYFLLKKKVLEIGCAKGFIVEDLREFGVDCYGLDVSSYAIGEASDSVKPFLTVGDARTILSKYKDNEFDMVFSLRFLECVDEKDLPDLILEMNRISKSQFHIIDEVSMSSYVEQPLNWWAKLKFSQQTILESNKSRNIINLSRSI